MNQVGIDPDIWLNFTFNPARLLKMQNGAQIIRHFVKLVLNQGLLNTDLLSKENLSDLATRLVDTQIPTASRRVKTLADIPLTPDHLNAVRFELRFLMNIARQLENFESLSIMQKLGLWQVCGATVSKDLVLSQKGIQDKWVARTIDISKEDSLVTRKIWYKGMESGLWLFTLDYAFGNQKLPEGPALYSKISGNAFLYPGTIAGRMLFADNSNVTRIGTVSTHEFETIFSLRSFIAGVYNKNVFFNEIPVSLINVRICHQNEKFYAIDIEGFSIELKDRSELLNEKSAPALWSLLANTGGKLTKITAIYWRDEYYLIG